MKLYVSVIAHLWPVYFVFVFVTVRQQIRLEETTVKEIEQNQLTWYGHVQSMAEGRLPKTALKWMPKQKTARGRGKKNCMEGIRKASGKSLRVGRRTKTF